MGIVVRFNVGDICNSLNIECRMKRATIENVDSKGRPYSVNIRYLKRAKVSSDVFPLADKGGTSVSKLLQYIYNKLNYGTCFIDINRKEVELVYKVNQGNISNALKYLTEHRAIYPLKDIEEVKNYEGVTSSTYFVNPNLMFYGDTNELAKELDKRYGEVYHSVKTGEIINLDLIVDKI